MTKLYKRSILNLIYLLPMAIVFIIFGLILSFISNIGFNPVDSDYVVGGFYLSYYNPVIQLARLLKKLDIPRTTFHGLRDTHASFLFSNDNIRLDYISQRLGHSNLQTTMNYYLELMPEKKHLQDTDALNLLDSLK